MTARNFDASLALTLVYEGGWSDNPKDPGGATMCGITQQVYDEDRDRRRLPRQSVRLSTVAERANIYRWRYWATTRGDDLPPGVDYATFDFAVNSGVARATKTLQWIVGAVDDSALGAATLARVQTYVENYSITALTDALCVARVQFLRGLPTFGTFGKGWTTRVMGAMAGHQATDTGVIDRAFVMACGGVAVAPVSVAATVKTYLAPVLLAA